MGKLIIIVVAFMAVWVAYCEGRYHEQLEQVKPAKFQETEHVRLIERALREADAYHKSQEKLGNNNPGNLRGRGGEFQAFKSPKEGYNALVHVQMWLAAGLFEGRTEWMGKEDGEERLELMGRAK